MTGAMVGLAIFAAAYAVVNGFNDGGALVGAAIQGSEVRPVPALIGATLAVTAVPLAVGAPVAETLSSRLVVFEGASGQRLMVTAVLAGLLVVAVSAWRGLPTSLTLATVGGFVGAGIGGGAATDFNEVTRVIVLGAVAPLAGGVLAFTLLWLTSNVIGGLPLNHVVGSLRRICYALVVLAYAANDAQKMIAVAVVALPAVALSAARPGVWLMLPLSGCFLVGAILGLRRAASTIGTGVLVPRTQHLIASELATAAAVAGTGAAGVPVSMTQTLAGSLAGSGVSDGAERVRWRVAARLSLAWLLTFPSALGLAFLGAAASAWILS